MSMDTSLNNTMTPSAFVESVDVVAVKVTVYTFYIYFSRGGIFYERWNYEDIYKDSKKFEVEATF